MAFKSDGMMIFTIFFGAIIAVTLLAVIGDAVFPTTNSITYANSTFTTGANNTNTTVDGRDLVGSFVIWNESNATVETNNVTLVEGLGTDGLKTIFIQVTDANFADTPLNFSYTFNPNGFLNNSGARSINNLVILFAALAIVVFAITRLWRNDSFQNLLGK